MFNFIIEDFNNGFMISRLEGYKVYISPEFEPLCISD